MLKNGVGSRLLSIVGKNANTTRHKARRMAAGGSHSGIEALNEVGRYSMLHGTTPDLTIVVITVHPAEQQPVEELRRRQRRERRLC